MRRLSGDRGAVAVTVAALSLVLFGFAALVVDVGALYAERRKLQSGADSGAFAIAGICAESGCPDASSATATATDYAGWNDREDGKAAAEICGSGASTWAPCSPAPPLPPGVKYVRVTDRTLSVAADGTTRTFLPPILVDALPGAHPDVRVGAQATTAWGYGTSSANPTLPFIMSVCAWKSLMPPTGKGFAPTPPLPLGDPVYPSGVPWSYEGQIHTQGGAGSCTFNPSGQTGADEAVSGDFGWTAVTDPGAKSSCISDSEVSADGTVTVEGKDGAQPCVKNWLDKHVGKIIDIPIYYEQPTKDGTFEVGGWAPFFLTGYRLDEKASATYPRGTVALPPCLADNKGKCLTGFLVNMPATDGPITGPSFGLASTDTKLIE